MKVSLDTLPEPGSTEAQPASERQVASAASNLVAIIFSSRNAMRLTCNPEFPIWTDCRPHGGVHRESLDAPDDLPE
jgi:hypothetical protein